MNTEIAGREHIERPRACVGNVNRDIVWTRIVFGNPFFDLDPLSFSQRHGSAIGSNAVPDFLNQGQPLLDWEAVDTQGFD